MTIHYSQPKGFVGRQLIYKVYCESVCYGAIVGGSATKHLPGRFEYLGSKIHLNNIVNNTFFHIEKQEDKYPVRNFAQKVVKLWREKVSIDWRLKYSDDVIAFETLVELPRTGELYRRDGWIETGITKGFTCKRVAGISTDSWGGMRVWDKVNLRPKKVFVRKNELYKGWSQDQTTCNHSGEENEQLSPKCISLWEM